MTEKIKNKKHKPNDDEIDLIVLAKTIWDGRMLIFKTIFIFMIVVIRAVGYRVVILAVK